jgi:hypothetical protein
MAFDGTASAVARLWRQLKIHDFAMAAQTAI